MCYIFATPENCQKSLRKTRDYKVQIILRKTLLPISKKRKIHVYTAMTTTSAVAGFPTAATITAAATAQHKHRSNVYIYIYIHLISVHLKMYTNVH